MSKKYSVFITALFCVFIFGFGIFFFAAPDRDFSEQENRYLSQFVAPTWESLKSGKFMEDFEDYVVDQFPLRDKWINLKAWGERILGKQENNKVYFGTDKQTLFAQFNYPTDLLTRVEYINKLGDKLNIPLYFSLVPDKSYVYSELLPDNAPNVDDGSMISDVQGMLSDKVTFIDLRDAFNIAANAPFYRTDHHWTTFGAYKGYLALGNAMNGTVTIPDYEPVRVTDSFFGTTISSAGTGWVTPDEMHIWISEDSGITVERYPEGRPVPGELYDESKLELKDKYSMFLGGNQPLCILRNENATTDKKLLVVRDSYSDSLAPFLAQDYAEVHLIDLRYYKMPLPMYVMQNGIDEALVLYSNSNFSTDNNLFMLGMG